MTLLIRMSCFCTSLAKNVLFEFIENVKLIENVKGSVRILHVIRMMYSMYML